MTEENAKKIDHTLKWIKDGLLIGGAIFTAWCWAVGLVGLPKRVDALELLAVSNQTLLQERAVRFNSIEKDMIYHGRLFVNINKNIEKIEGKISKLPQRQYELKNGRVA